MKPEPLPPLPERPIWPAPPEPARGVISWNMNTSCNYRCGYCTQRFLDDRGRWASDLPRFLAAFARLPGAWEIKLSGGEPFVQPAPCIVLAQAARAQGLSVWAYSGFTYEELLAHPDPQVQELLLLCDVLVDGRFELEQRSLELRFRGSRNQRLIDLPATRAAGQVVCWAPPVW